MHILINFCRFLGCLAEPYMPSFSAKLYEILGIVYEEKQSTLLKTIWTFIEQNPENSHMFLLKLDFLAEGHLINDPLPLFRKITEEETEQYKKTYG
jgi:methionyl-tRNA synthetase